nr:SURF1 family protein [Canibacter zhuwentaonis]
MLRPKSLLALLVALVVASGFAWLAQWQLGNAVQAQTAQAYDSENVVPLRSVNVPGEPLDDIAAGHRVQVEGALTGDTQTVINRQREDGAIGYWLVTRAVVGGADAPVNLAVVVGWAADEQQITVAAQKLQGVAGESAVYTGRYNPTEPPQRSSATGYGDRLATVAPAQLINIWGAEAVSASYSGFLVLEPETQLLQELGLERIHSRAPQQATELNWLNLFYAIEWVLFACFAVYFWVRIMRDTWEKEHELRLAPAL